MQLLLYILLLVSLNSCADFLCFCLNPCKDGILSLNLFFLLIYTQIICESSSQLLAVPMCSILGNFRKLLSNLISSDIEAP